MSNCYVDQLLKCCNDAPPRHSIISKARHCPIRIRRLLVRVNHGTKSATPTGRAGRCLLHREQLSPGSGWRRLAQRGKVTTEAYTSWSTSTGLKRSLHLCSHLSKQYSSAKP